MDIGRHHLPPPSPDAPGFSSDVFSTLDLAHLGTTLPPIPLQPLRCEYRVTCTICYDEYVMQEMITMPGCNHRLCKQCTAAHVQARMSEGVYPIICPHCAVDRSIAEKTEIEHTVLAHLADVFSEQDYARFEDMQLSPFAMTVQCPDCKNEMKAAREDLDHVLLQCPLPACGSKWCRACGKAVSSCSRPHRCKPDRQLRRTMRRNRWKFCPGCHTPVQRIEGCSHMTCSVPGCRTHFCYRCGLSIWKPGQRGSGYGAANWHIKWCRLVFPFGCSIQ